MRHENANRKQTWFPGVHSSVGGGSKRCALSLIALIWMIDKAQQHTNLEFDMECLENIVRRKHEELRQREWGCGDYKDTVKDGYRLTGRWCRTPGRYGQDTYEFVHSSVRARERGLLRYQPRNLENIPEEPLGNLEAKMKEYWGPILSNGLHGIGLVEPRTSVENPEPSPATPTGRASIHDDEVSLLHHQIPHRTRLGTEHGEEVRLVRR
jgi:Uncharacterized alpha/beta hydrolase domain (DUF2235)